MPTRGQVTRAIVSAAKGAGDIALDQVHGVTFRSQVSPDIPLTARQAVGQEPLPVGVSDLWLRMTKPAVYVDTTLGTLRIAPWGEPTMNLYPVFIIGSMVLGATVAGLITRGLRK